MNKKTLIIIACSVAAGIIAVVLVNYYITRQEKAIYKGMELVSVIAVTKDVPAGTKLTGGMLAKRKVPEKYVHGNAVDPKDANLVIGQILNFPLKRGDVILWTDLQEEGGLLPGLAGTVTKGERALAIAVDSVSGVSGLLKPNDHIDILCTVRSQETGEEATVTLVQNITVLATGSALSGEKPTRHGGYGTVTLLVTLEEAELLVFAQTKGRIVALLRNPEDIDTSKDIPKVTFSDIMKKEYRNQIQQRRDRIEVIKKGKVEK
jgi:pilus assembly protein CpaB